MLPGELSRWCGKSVEWTRDDEEGLFLGYLACGEQVELGGDVQKMGEAKDGSKLC